MSRISSGGAGVLGVAWWLALAATAQTPATQPSTADSAASQPETAAAAGSEAPPSLPKSILDVRELMFELGMEGRFDRQKVTSPSYEWWRGPTRQTDRTWELGETVGMHTQGALLDERWLLYDAAVRWGLTQDWYSETGFGPNQYQRPHGDLLEYNVNLSVLPQGKLSGDLYAVRENSRVPRAFLPSLDRTLEKYGADLYVNDRTFPMRFTFEHVWDELRSRTSDLNDDEQRGDNRFRYEGTWQISDRQSLRLEYEYDDRTERYSGSRTRFDTVRNNLILDHMLRFGPDGRSSWETLAHLQYETGDLGRDVAEVSTRLKLQHTNALSSNFAAQLLQESFQELSTQTWRMEGGLTHQIGQVLTNTLQVYGFKQHANENADFVEWGALANSSYSQDNALGRLSANVSYNHATTTTENGTRRGVVIGEAVTFRDPLPAYLLKTGIDRASIVVTDADRARTFLTVRDYVIVPLGHYTALVRVPTGQITDKQTVLVTYTYKVADNYEVNTNRLDARIQQDFKFGLSPYYAASLQWQEISPTNYLSYEARDINRQRLGAIFRQPRWSVGSEYEFNDDTIDPYQAVHGNGDVVLLQNAAMQLDGKTDASQFWFRGTNGEQAHDTTLLDIGMSYRYVLTQMLEASASAMYRYEDDSLAGVTQGVDLTTALEWKLGYFDLRFEAEYDRLKLPDSNDDGFSVWIKLKRDIPVIMRPER